MKKLVFVTVFLFLIISCKNDPPKKTDNNSKHFISLSNEYNRITLALPDEFDKSQATSYPYQGFRIINKDLQIYGFISIKDYENSDLDPLDIIENIFSTSWNRFTKNWESYLNIQNVTINTKTTSDFLTLDKNKNIIKVRNFTLTFPQLYDINIEQVGRYFEKSLSSYEMVSGISKPAPSKEWINYNEFYGSFAISLLTPEETGTNMYKVIISALVTLNKDIKPATYGLFNTIEDRADLCIGECTVNSTEEKITIQEKSKPISLLTVIKNTQNMELEINKLDETFWSELYDYLSENNLELNATVVRISNPDSFKEYGGKPWISNSVSKNDWNSYFKVTTTTLSFRNSLLSTGLNAIDRAYSTGFFKKSSTNVILFISDKDDQSIIDNKEITIDNIDKFAEQYKDKNVLTFAIIGTENIASLTNCDGTENSSILRRFVYLLRGNYSNICLTDQNKFIEQYFFRKILRYNSIVTTKFYPIYNLSSLSVNDLKYSWSSGINNYYATPETLSVLVEPIPKSGDNLIFNYLFFK